MVDKSNDSTATDADLYAKDDADFQKIETQRYMYNPEKCGKVPLTGYLLNLLDMPPIERAGELKPWQAFLIKTTRPTKALNREKDVIEVSAGSEVLIPATFELMQFFSKAATNENLVFEVKITPDTKLDLDKGGQKMWLYDLRNKPIPVRRNKFGLAAVLAPPQLPAAASNSVETTGDELPNW